MVNFSNFLLVLAIASLIYLQAVAMLATRLKHCLQARKHRASCPNGHCFPIPEPRPTWKLWYERLILALSFLGILLLAWSFIEPYYPQVEHVTLSTKKISAPVRIVQISDLHCDPTVRLEERLPGIIAAQKPDLIVFTGDGINCYEGIPVFRQCMRELTKIAPVVGVDGNWEAWWFSDVDIFESTGVHKLNGDALTLTLNGQTIGIAGTGVMYEDRTERALAQLPTNAFRIFLHHYPSMCRQVEGKVDLHLAGDTHGGQVTFPGLGPLIKIMRQDKTYYTAGLHPLKSGFLYVNRGIGMEGGHVPRVRFCCPPEITVIDLKPSHS